MMFFPATSPSINGRISPSANRVMVTGKNGNGRMLSDQSSMNSYIKSICDIMRRDKTKGAMQYIPELTWMMFLRILDEKEQEEEMQCEAVGKSFTPSLNTPFRWRDWGSPEGKKRKEIQEKGIPKSATGKILAI